jgi:hypothetical protein
MSRRCGQRGGRLPPALGGEGEGGGCAKPFALAALQYLARE